MLEEAVDGELGGGPVEGTEGRGVVEERGKRVIRYGRTRTTHRLGPRARAVLVQSGGGGGGQIQ